MLGFWKWSQSPFDVDFVGPNVPLDTLNAGLPILAAQLQKHPGARTFRIRYAVLPDPARPRETLPRRLEFSRAAKRLDWHRDALWIDRFDGATHEIILAVAAQEGGIRKLIRAGCRRSLPPEN